MATELYHYGRKGMKWYQNIYTQRQAHKRNKMVKRYRDIATPEQVDNYISLSSRKERRANNKKYRDLLEQKTGDDMYAYKVGYENTRFKLELDKADKKYARKRAQGKKNYDSTSVYKKVYKMYDSESSREARRYIAEGRKAIDEVIGDIGKSSNVSAYDKQAVRARREIERIILGHAGDFILENPNNDERLNSGRGAKLDFS